MVAEGDGGGEKLTVLGSTCFAKRFGRADALGQARYGGGQGRVLTAGERQLLVDNTAALLALLEQERHAHEIAATERLNAMRAAIEQDRLARELAAAEKRTAMRAVFENQHRSPIPANFSQSSNGTQLLGIPWPWAKPMSSIAYFQMPDGTGWVRVQHKTGDQILMPWPAFDGWDEAFPARVGVPDPELGGLRSPNIIQSVDYLKRTARSMKVGIWREVIDGTKV